MCSLVTGGKAMFASAAAVLSGAACSELSNVGIMYLVMLDCDNLSMNRKEREGLVIVCKE